MRATDASTTGDTRLEAAPARQPTTSRLTLAFWGLLLAATLVRCVGLDRPLVGNFATKNVVYAMIARNWATGRASLWHPTLDTLAGGDRAWHLTEFPLAAYVAGAAWRSLGGSLDMWGRATAVAFSVASVALMFLLARRWHGTAAAWGAAAVLAFAPVSIIYGQSFMLESSVVCLTLGTVLAFDHWLAGRQWWSLALAAACFALLVLTKVYMAALVLPLAVMAWREGANISNGGGSPPSGLPGWSARWKASGLAALAYRLIHHPDERDGVSGQPSLRQFSPANDALTPQTCANRFRTCALATAAMALALVPAAVWYAHVLEVSSPGSPHAERVYYSIADSTDAHRFPHPLLTSAEFYRGLLDDLSGVVLTPVALVLVCLGLWHPGWRRHLAWLAVVGVLVLLMPRKFHEMNYYFLVILPPLCLLAGLGWDLIQTRLRPGRWAVAGVCVVAALFSARYASGPAFGTPEEDRGVVAAAEAARRIVPEGEPIVTMHGSTLDLLYYCDRPGSAVSPRDKELAARLDEAARQGARWLVATGPESVLPLGRDAIAEQQPEFTIYRLGASEPEDGIASRPLQAPSKSGMPTAPGTR